MSLAALLNRPMTIVHRSGSEEMDDYGNPIPSEDESEVVGELQQTRRDEPGDEGEFSDTRWTIFLPAGTALSTGDAVIVDGEVYEVVGDPWQARNPRTQAFSHVEATARRTAASGDEVAS